MRHTNRRLLSVAAMGLFSAAAAQAQIGFGTGTHYSAGMRPSGVALGDFDGDGDRDMAVTTDTPDKVSIFFNSGAGAFAGPVQVFLGGAVSPQSIVTRDFDADGDLDLAVCLKGMNAVRMVMNMNGTFVPGQMVGVNGSEPRFMAAGDLDGDGDQDLVTSNRKSDNFSVLLNSGGTFSYLGSFGAGGDPRKIDLGDFNGDGILDVAVSAHNDRAVRLLMGVGNGSFTTGPSLLLGSQLRPDGVSAADLDGDGDVDVSTATSSTAQNFVSVFLNTGGGGFMGPFHYAPGGVNPDDLAPADYDMDGDLDLAVTNQDSNSFGALANTGAGTFGGPAVFGTGARPGDLEAADLDGNGSPDLVVTNRDSNSVTVFLNTAGGLGTNYCSSNPNSTGKMASLTASGSPVVAVNNLTFLISSMPSNQFGYLLMSDTQGFVSLFGGSQGNLCLGGTIVRFGKFIQNSGPSGSVTFSPDLTNLPSGTTIQGGETWSFQYWFRDVNGGFKTSNTSNGLAIDFL